jgi:hypothetical protein
MRPLSSPSNDVPSFYQRLSHIGKRHELSAANEPEGPSLPLKSKVSARSQGDSAANFCHIAPRLTVATGVAVVSRIGLAVSLPGLAVRPVFTRSRRLRGDQSREPRTAHAVAQPSCGPAERGQVSAPGCASLDHWRGRRKGQGQFNGHGGGERIHLRVDLAARPAVHLVTHHVEFALDEGVVRNSNTTGTAGRAALYDHAHGTNLLLVAGVTDQPAARRMPSCAPAKHAFSGREVNGGASTGMRASNEASRDLIGAESKPGPSAVSPPQQSGLGPGAISQAMTLVRRY